MSRTLRSTSGGSAQAWNGSHRNAAHSPVKRKSAEVDYSEISTTNKRRCAVDLDSDDLGQSSRSHSDTSMKNRSPGRPSQVELTTGQVLARDWRERLFQLLSSTHPSFAWATNGKSFTILDVNKFETEVLPCFASASSRQATMAQQSLFANWYAAMITYGFSPNTSPTLNKDEVPVRSLVWRHPTIQQTSSREEFAALTCTKGALKAKTKQLKSSEHPEPMLYESVSDVREMAHADIAAVPQALESNSGDAVPPAVPQAGASKDNFLVKLFRLTRDPANASIIRGEDDPSRGHARIVVRDPDGLPGVLRKRWGGVHGFYPEFEKWGFRFVPYKIAGADAGLPVTRHIVYAWTHPALTSLREYTEDQLEELTPELARQLTGNEN